MFLVIVQKQQYIRWESANTVKADAVSRCCEWSYIV